MMHKRRMHEDSTSTEMYIDPEAQGDLHEESSPTAVHDLGITAKRAVRTLFSEKKDSFGDYKASAVRCIEEIGKHKGFQVVSDQTKAVLLRCASILIVSTYLEDAVRMIRSPMEMASAVGRELSLWWPLSALALVILTTTQLSSLALLIPLDKYPAAARHVRVVCGGLAGTVLMQPILFGVWTYTLLTMSVAQLAALAIFYIDAFAVEHPSAAASEFASYVLLCGRVGLTTDLLATYTARLLSEATAVLSKVLGSNQTAELAVAEQAASARLQASLLTLPVDQHEEAERTFAAQIQAIHDDAATFRLHDAHTLLAAAFLLAAFVLVCLGFRTRVVAAVAACGALVDATYRFPFLSEGGEWNRFHFFQAMTPVGGLALIAAFGPGAMSLDATLKKGT